MEASYEKERNWANIAERTTDYDLNFIFSGSLSYIEEAGNPFTLQQGNELTGAAPSLSKIIVDFTGLWKRLLTCFPCEREHEFISDFFLCTLCSCLYLWTGSVDLPPRKKENSYLEEFPSCFVQAEMKTWRLWKRRIGPRDCLKLYENDQTEPFPVTEHCWHVIGRLSVFIN